MSEIADLAKRIETVIERAKPTVESTRWTSSRLWTTAAAVLVLVWLCRGTIASALWPITTIVCTFLITRTATDISVNRENGQNGRLHATRRDPPTSPQ